MAVAKQLNRVHDETQTRYFLALVIEGGATALTVGKWVQEFLTKKTSPASEGTTGPAIAGAETAEIVGPVCFVCQKPDNPYNLENVWVHQWEKKMIESQIAGAATVAPGDLRES